MRTPWLPALLIVLIPILLICLELLAEFGSLDLLSLLRHFTAQDKTEQTENRDAAMSPIS